MAGVATGLGMCYNLCGVIGTYRPQLPRRRTLMMALIKVLFLLRRDSYVYCIIRII